MSVCSIEGCERPATKHGLCPAHYRRWRRGRESPHPIGAIPGYGGTLPWACVCPVPDLLPMGDCGHCHRLVVPARAPG